MRDAIKVDALNLIRTGILSVFCFACILFCMNNYGLLSIIKIRSGLSLLFAFFCIIVYGYCIPTRININILPTYVFFLSALIVSLTFSNSYFTGEIALYLVAITIILYVDLNLESTVQWLVIAEGVAFFIYYSMKGRMDIQSNSLGLLFSNFVILFMNYMVIKGSLFKRWSLIVVGALIVFLFFTRSRSALLGTVCVLCVNIIRYYSHLSWHSKARIILAMIAAFILLLVLDTRYELFSKAWIFFRSSLLNKWTASEEVTISSFTSHRTTIWAAAFNRVSWLGNGYYDYDVFTLHNVIIQTLDTFGVIVSAMFIWMMIGIFVGTKQVANTVHRWVYYDFFIYWVVLGLLENVYLIGGRMFLINFTALAFISMVNREITTDDDYRGC